MDSPHGPSMEAQGWSESHVNSIPQLAPMYHNVVAQTSQGNLLQQQQQQQQPNNQQQPMQSQQFLCYPTNLQGNYGQNQYGQPYQQEAYGIAQQQQQQQQQQQIPRSGIGSLGPPIGQTAYTVPSIMQGGQVHGYGSLPAHILDQIRAYIGTPPAPIFILPSNCPTPATPQAVTPGPPIAPGCPGVGINCPSSLYCPPGPCYPCPMTMPPYSPFVSTNRNTRETSKNCGCCSPRYSGSSEGRATSNESDDHQQQQHRCLADGSDAEVVCTKRNCPSAINLQALASQLLAVQGIIACAATRLVLRRVAGSDVTSTVEETMERAKSALNGLTQDQLLLETRQAQQVNALINLHMTANPPPSVVPILTTVQLKVNVLKAHADASINRRLSESQGADGNATFDPVVLALRSDQELRDLLAALRQRECEERVNLNFAPYRSQRVIAESRLNCARNKIAQVEAEMERRRGAASNVARSSVAQQFSDPGWYGGYTGDVGANSTANEGRTTTQNYVSPDPFSFQTRASPKRLIVRPHVGSPETTYYERPKKSTAPRSSSTARNQRDSDCDDEDCEESTKNSARDASAENRRCACEKSSEDDSADEGKKKLGGKIAAPRDRLVGLNEDDGGCRESGVSVLRLSRNVVIVVDGSCVGRRGVVRFDVTDGAVDEKSEFEDKTKIEEKGQIDKNTKNEVKLKIEDNTKNEEKIIIEDNTKNEEKIKTEDKSKDEEKIKIEDKSKNEEKIKIEDKSMNEEKIKIEDNPKNEEKIKIENKSKNEEKMKIEDEMKNEENIKIEDHMEIGNSERSVETKIQPRISTNDGVVDKIRKFSWRRKREKTEDESADFSSAVDPPEVKVKEEIESEKSFDIGRSAEDYEEPSRIDDYSSGNRDADGPEPVREQTVRMITKIDYEPSVFRAFLDPRVDERPEKERRGVEVRSSFSGSFAEDSSKSASTASTEDSLKSSSVESNENYDRTPDATSLRAEEFAEASVVVIPGNAERDLAAALPCEPPRSELETATKEDGGAERECHRTRLQIVGDSGRIRRLDVVMSGKTATEEPGAERESGRTRGNIVDEPQRIHRSGPSRHNDESEESSAERDDDTSVNQLRVAEDDLISGALTTIGHHVASFGSIIGKIAALELHRVAESSRTLFGDSATIEPTANEAGKIGSSDDAAAENSSKSERKKEIGKWKYIKFAEVDDTLNAKGEAENSDGESEYPLPKIKHSVIEDKSRGSKYVVIEEPSEELRRELGEPYRTGRSLVIRSRPRTQSEAASEKSQPLSVVKGPKLGDKNCLALHFVSPKSSTKSRSRDVSRDLRSSEKFWFRPETRDEVAVETRDTGESSAGGFGAETIKLATDRSVYERKSVVADSGTSVSDERVVEVHEYSMVRENREKSGK